MSTKYLMKKLPSCLLGAILAAGIASTTMVNAVDGNPPGLFELEGNPEGEGTPGDDWEVLYNFGGNDGGSPFAFTGIVHDVSATDRVFFQGGSKDIYDVDKWKYSEGSTPDKNEITNAYAAAYNNPTDVCVTAGVAGDCAEGQTPVHEAGDLIVYFGLDRFANDGDALAGFWFFQGEVSQTEPSNQDTGDFIGNHVAMRDNPDFGLPGEPEFLPGDMFIIVNYPQGANAQPEIKVYQWDPNDVDGDVNFDPSEQTKPPKNLSSPLDLVFTDAQALCDGAGDKLACAITNPADIENSPEWEYTPKSGLATTLPHESLFEGGINVSALLGTTPCFASFLAETRSSTSQTAQLKDYVFGAFPVCGIEVDKQCNAVLNNGGANVKVSFFGNLENTGGSSYLAFLKDSVSGATIDAVCIDTDSEGCADDTLITTTSLNGGVYFSLAGGVTVRYEGHYETVGLPANKEQSDTITAEAYAEAADIGVSDPIVDDEATAKCDYGYIAGLLVTKNCDALFVGGTGTTVHVTGTVKNTGTVPLEMEALSDSTGIPVAFDPPLTDNILAAGATANYNGEKAVDYTALITNVSADTNPADNIVAKTVTLQHKDQVTATGKVIASDDSTLETKVEKSNEATCGDTFISSFSVEKACDGVEVVPLGGKVVVKAKVKATVTNLGEEILNITSLLDDPALEGGFSGVPSSLAVGAFFNATGFYYPSAEDNDGTNPGTASFTDTATANASGASSSASLGAFDDATCELCPD